MEVIDYENYLIYEDGKVYNQKYKRYLKYGSDGAGYLQVKLYKNGISKTLKIHRLVGLHYIPNPDNKRCLDHINRNTKDNTIENLRWVTDLENQQNRGMSKNNKLGIKNISYCKTHNCWKYVKVIRAVSHQKYFKTIEEAIEYKKEYESTLDRRIHPL